MTPGAALSFSIRDWFAWKPGHETRASWLPAASATLPAPAAEPDWAIKTAAALPMMLRRRLSEFGQKVVGSALALPAAKHARYVFASRYGEFTTTVRILEDLHKGTLPSPTDFSLSVHHALAGLLSIQTGNKAGHTTVSAGRDTFGYGLLEAVAFCAEQPDQSALLVAYDEPLPDIYHPFRSADEAGLPLVVALEIVADLPAATRYQMEMHPGTMPAAPGPAVTSPLSESALNFFLSDRAEASLSGDTMNWILRRVTSH